jgi:hypothetical protein
LEYISSSATVSTAIVSTGIVSTAVDRLSGMLGLGASAAPEDNTISERSAPAIAFVVVRGGDLLRDRDFSASKARALGA